MFPRPILAAVALVAFSFTASAQTTTYDVKTMNFDLWCQEQANLPPDRCDQRLPEDEAQFEAFRAKIEKYELPYLQAKQREYNFNQRVLRNDPIDKQKDKQPPSSQSVNTNENSQPSP